MSNVNNRFKELINEAIHNHFHDKTELEMTLKDWLYGICEQDDEYEVKNKELLEELQYLRKVNDDLVWQRDTDEEHEAKAKAFDAILKAYDEAFSREHMADGVSNIIEKYESGESE